MKQLLKPQSFLIIGLSLVSLGLTLIFTKFGVNKEFRLGGLFLIFNFVSSYFIGYWIKKQQLNWNWIWFFPVVFAILVFLIYAKYNFIFAVCYLLLEILGLNYQKVYR